MRQVLRVKPPSGSPSQQRIDRPASAGGSQADGLVIAGLPPTALRLLPCAAGVVVEPLVLGARVGGHPVSPGKRRLLRPGQRAELLGAELALADPAAEVTRVEVGALLAGGAAGEPAPPGPHLVVVSGRRAGERIPLSRAEEVIGRGRGATVRLLDPLVSRRHARLVLDGAGARVEDLGAKNPLRLNGAPLGRGAVALRPEDELVIGETAVALVLPAGPGSAPPPPPPGPPPTRKRPAPGPSLAAALLLALSAALALAGGAP